MFWASLLKMQVVSVLNKFREVGGRKFVVEIENIHWYTLRTHFFLYFYLALISEQLNIFF